MRSEVYEFELDARIPLSEAFDYFVSKLNSISIENGQEPEGHDFGGMLGFERDGNSYLILQCKDPTNKGSGLGCLYSVNPYAGIIEHSSQARSMQTSRLTVENEKGRPLRQDQVDEMGRELSSLCKTASQ